MFKSIKKFFSYSNKKKSIDNLRNIEKITPVTKIFNSINIYSDESEIFYVGGCVRKCLNNEEIDDIDLTTNLTPDEVIDALKKSGIEYYESGKKHGTVTAIINNFKFEITTLREDLFTDGRHAEVKFTKDLKKDASRRDFTINSIYSNIDGDLFDPFNGKQDLEKGIIRFIGDPNARIKEDYLRILRYLRFFLNYSKVNHQTEVKKKILQNINGISKISKERLLDELKKIIFSKGFLAIKKDEFSKKILELIFPEFNQYYFIKPDNKKLLELIRKKDFILILSAMMTKNMDELKYFLFKYPISNKDKNRINFLIKKFDELSDKNFFKKENLMKLNYKVGKPILLDLLNLKILVSNKNHKLLEDTFRTVLKQNVPIFPIKAENLMKNYKLKEGKFLGTKLDEIEQYWIENNFKISNEEIKRLIHS